MTDYQLTTSGGFNKEKSGTILRPTTMINISPKLKILNIRR